MKVQKIGQHASLGKAKVGKIVDWAKMKLGKMPVGKIVDQVKMLHWAKMKLGGNFGKMIHWAK